MIVYTQLLLQIPSIKWQINVFPCYKPLQLLCSIYLSNDLETEGPPLWSYSFREVSDSQVYMVELFWFLHFRGHSSILASLCLPHPLWMDCSPSRLRTGLHIPPRSSGILAPFPNLLARRPLFSPLSALVAITSRVWKLPYTPSNPHFFALSVSET